MDCLRSFRDWAVVHRWLAAPANARDPERQQFQSYCVPQLGRQASVPNAGLNPEWANDLHRQLRVKIVEEAPAVNLLSGATAAAYRRAAVRRSAFSSGVNICVCDIRH